MHNVSVIAQFKKKNTGDDAGIIFIRGYMNRSPVKAKSTGYKIKECHWDHSRRSVKENAPNAALINMAISQKLQAIQSELLKIELANGTIDKNVLAALIGGENKADLLLYAAKVIAEKKLKDGQPYNPETKRRYKSEISRLQSFSDKIAFADVTAPFLARYKNWLQNTCTKKDGNKLHQNTVWKAMAFIRMIWREAIKEKIINENNNPFKSGKVGRYHRSLDKIRFLEVSHLDAIEKLLMEKQQELNTITLQVGWRFLFMCVSGLRISDAVLINDHSLAGSGMMKFTPHKTKREGNSATVPIVNERQLRYLKKTIELSFPEKKLSHARKIFNEELKIIARMAGITMHITSHVGRHSMGSFLVDSSIDDKAAQAILGIKTSEVLQTYQHLKESKLLLEAEKLNKVF